MENDNEEMERGIRVFVEYFRGIWWNRFILASLVNKDLQIKYKRSKLGVAWAVLTPLGLVLIIGGVYSIIFGTDPKTFIPLLFAGLTHWMFLNGTAEGGTMAFISAEGYLKQTTVNAQIFPLRVTLVNFVNLLYSLLAFLAIYLFLRPECFSARMLMCIPGVALLFLFSLGIANIASVINLNVRDYQPLQSLILQGLFYATPIIFEVSMLEEKGFGFVYRINPFYYFIELVRTPLQGRGLPTAGTYLTAVLIAAGVFLVSIAVVMQEKKKIPFKL